ncbi:MAG: 3-hydroxybutyryl-CoA dehydrogenase [Candidatus Velthaea sp.]
MYVKILVVGAGQMGAGIAQVCAQSGHEVLLNDIDDARIRRGIDGIAKLLDRAVEKGRMPADERAAVLARISTLSGLTERVPGVQIAIEAATENVDLKLQIFRALDAIVPEGAILASNTSSISITAIGAVTSRAERVIGMHFMNPVPVMKLVEIIRGIATSEATYTEVRDLAVQLEKTPVEARDFPGFVANRILLPMINEAIYALYEGVASVEGIDTVMKLGMHHPMGPLALADFIGLDTCLAIMEVLHAGMGDSKYRPCPLLRQYVAAGWLGKKSGRGFYDYRTALNSAAAPVAAGAGR